MTTTMSIRDLTRNGSMLGKYDYINIEDKKSNEYKGVFISPQYAEMVKKFLKKEILKKEKKELDEMMQFAGMMNGETQNLSMQELKEQKGQSL